jgi:superfamily II DNA or RNA helicase
MKRRLDLSGLKDYQRDHAVRLFRALLLLGAALDASDTGTGKTYAAIWAAREFGTIPLIICPKSVRLSWKQALREMGIEGEVVNYEKIRGVRRKGLLARSQWGQEIAVGKGSRWEWANNYQMVIFDEVDRCGGMTSLNSKLLIAARRQAEMVLCLSATAADDPRQLKALGFALRLFTLDRFKWWLLRHGCVPGRFGGFEFVKDPDERHQAMLQIHQEIFGAGRGSRMRKSQIPGFPETLVDVKLIDDESGEAKNLAAELAGQFEAGNHLAEVTALRQRLELLKVLFLVEMAEHYAKTSKVAIFVNYKETVAALQKALGRVSGTEVPSIDGSNTEAEREAIKLRFQANEIPVVICNIQAGGIGIGLHDPTGAVDRTSLICPCYSARNIQQVLGRVCRSGGAFSEQYLVYFADTLEAEIAAVVQGKLDNLTALNDATLNGVFQ